MDKKSDIKQPHKRNPLTKRPIGPKVCIDPNCGRPAYARGMCQTHHRQLLKTGETRPIRNYRQRSTETTKFSGLRLSTEAATEIDSFAKQKDISNSAAIAEILEEWVRKRK